jgi:hypothetical protein
LYVSDRGIQPIHAVGRQAGRQGRRGLFKPKFEVIYLGNYVRRAAVTRLVGGQTIGGSEQRPTTSLQRRLDWTIGARLLVSSLATAQVLGACLDAFAMAKLLPLIFFAAKL